MSEIYNSGQGSGYRGKPLHPRNVRKMKKSFAAIPRIVKIADEHQKNDQKDAEKLLQDNNYV